MIVAPAFMDNAKATDRVAVGAACQGYGGNQEGVPWKDYPSASPRL